jgi:sugar phosphate isomerase/epimerase
VEETLKQISLALRECGEFAQDYGIDIWLEVHGRGTSNLRRIRNIMETTNHESVGVCWNSNLTDVEKGSVKANFALVKDWIRNMHINELYLESYPWRELFILLKESRYRGYTLAEIPNSPEPERLMRYYRALWLELTRNP